MHVRVGLAGWGEIGIEEKTRICLENAVEKSGIVGVYCPTDTNIWFNPVNSQLNYISIAVLAKLTCWRVTGHDGCD